MSLHNASHYRPRNEGPLSRVKEWLEDLELSRLRRGPAARRSRAHARGLSTDDLSRASFESGHRGAYQVPESGGPNVLRRRLVVLAVLVALIVVGLVRVSILRSRVNTVLDQAEIVLESLQTGDSQRLRTASAELDEAIDAIDRQVHSLPWHVMGALPVVGRDVRGVQDIVAAVHDFSDAALPALASLPENVSVDNLFVDEAVNIETLVAAQDLLRTIAPELRRAADDISAVPTARIKRLDDVESQAKALLLQVADIVDAAKEVDIPAMFGANGERRTYLIVAQTNAELRATGGFPGAWVPVYVQDGEIELGDTQTIQHFETDFDWTAEEREVFYITGERDTSAVNFTPNFPLVGFRFAKAFQDYMNTIGMQEAEEAAYDNYYLGLTDTIETDGIGETAIDGVILIDPVFLQRLLALTPGVKVYGERVTGENAAQMLMHDAYVNYTTARQDRFFSRVASKTFRKVMASLDSIDKGDLVKVFTTSIADYRLQVWMATEAEEKLMIAMGVSGAIESDETRPELGVYVNDNTWAKIDWYLKMQTEIGEQIYNADGTTTYAVTTTFTNTGSYDELKSLKGYISGFNGHKDRVDDMILYPLLMAPAGGSISNVEVSKGNDFMEFTLYGRDVWEGLIHVHGEQTVTVTYDVTVSSEAQTVLSLRTTPTAQEF